MSLEAAKKRIDDLNEGVSYLKLVITNQPQKQTHNTLEFNAEQIPR